MSNNTISTIKASSTPYQLGPMGMLFDATTTLNDLEEYFREIYLKVKPFKKIQRKAIKKNHEKVVFLLDSHIALDEIRPFLKYVDIPFQLSDKYPPQGPCLIVPLSKFENLYPEVDQNPRVWIGETQEGPFVGPVIKSDHQALKNLRRNFLKWSRTQKLAPMGLDISKVPCSFFYFIKNKPRFAWRVLKEVITQHRESSYMLLPGRFYKVWDESYRGKFTIAEIKKYFIWERGLFKRSLAGSKKNGIYVERLQAECMGIDYLEQNSGKGVSFHEASSKALYESLERSSAFLANEVLQGKTHLQAYILGKNSTRRLRSDLVPFPNVLRGKWKRAHTSGLAFHRQKSLAQLKAIEEVLEKDNLYRNFLNLHRPYTVPKKDQYHPSHLKGLLYYFGIRISIAFQLFIAFTTLHKAMSPGDREVV
jgi:hypothetical protein